MFIRHYPNILAIVSPATFQNLTPPILEVVLVLVDTCESVLSQVFFRILKLLSFNSHLKLLKEVIVYMGNKNRKQSKVGNYFCLNITTLFLRGVSSRYYLGSSCI